MPRNKTMIYADTASITYGGTEADMMCWVRVTEMLMRARTQREASLATTTMVRRTTMTISFTVAAPSPLHQLAVAA